jgi:hypothetical protein
VLGHLQVNKLFTINNSEEKTYTWAYLEVLRIRGVQQDLLLTGLCFICDWLKLYKYVKSVLD